MPGILPMKVIKVGTNAQTRIAQACDRCRSKKIRCDGVRPCCSQCANVGFECKTSDKLSRRAFPRGYTESLEERVRGLETEVRELKDLLDEKDEKIDMLSRIHSQSSVPIHQLPSPRRPSTSSTESNGRDEFFHVQQSPYLLNDDDQSGSYFAGTSSGRNFIEAFKHRVEGSGRATANIDTASLLPGNSRKPRDSPMSPSSPVVWKAPPRLVSDQLINIFFQEWSPLFPILHRPTFLTLYERYVGDCDSIDDKADIAQINLVFGIAALSSGSRSSADLDSFEAQWKAAMDAIMAETSMSNLQALILAQLFCIQQGDYTRLLTYKGLSTTISARLGLHQSQKRFALGTLTCETRKKVFWCLYTIDSFTAAILGLPKHLKDDDVQCEYPVDADDEYITEGGFQPTLPGESTKLSSALALFRASRIISKVLEEVFPAKASYELSLKKLAQFSDELDAWRNNLAPHLRLQFAQDKPSTGTISSRSPLLSLAYHYTRALIHRPPVCASLGESSSSSMIALAGACKHMIQIIELLDERGLSFSFCLNRDEVLVLSGFGLLFQELDLEAGSKISKDNSKMMNSIINALQKSRAPCASDFECIAASLLPLHQESKLTIPPVLRQSPEEITRSSTTGPGSPPSTRKQLKVIASRLTAGSASQPLTDEGRQATVPHVGLHPESPKNQSRPVSALSYDPASLSRSEPARSPINMYSRPTSTTARPSAPPPQLNAKSPLRTVKLPNLDYLSFGNEIETESKALQSQPVKAEPTPTDWEKLLGSLDNGETNIYDACYGGPPVDALLDVPPLGMHHHASAATLRDANLEWNVDMRALYHTEMNGTANAGFIPCGPADSTLSISTDESFSSGDELSADWASASSSTGWESLRGIVLPDLAHNDMNSECKTGVSFEDVT